jgi:hypothetical protein
MGANSPHIFCSPRAVSTRGQARARKGKQGLCRDAVRRTTALGLSTAFQPLSATTLFFWSVDDKPRGATRTKSASAHSAIADSRLHLGRTVSSSVRTYTGHVNTTFRLSALGDTRQQSHPCRRPSTMIRQAWAECGVSSLSLFPSSAMSSQTCSSRLVCCAWLSERV